MRTLKILCFAFLLLHAGLNAQTRPLPVASPAANDFAPVQAFLASGQLEGREAGSRGAAVAADYIASVMQQLDLKPYRRSDLTAGITLSDYFQTFSLLRFWPLSTTIEVNSLLKNMKPALLQAGRDYTVKNLFQSFTLKSAPVFAGYGINSAVTGYNDYAGRDVKGKLVILLDGYPGQHDTLSMAFRAFRSLAQSDGYDLDMKCREAARQGAAAIMLIHADYLKPKNTVVPANKAEVPADPPYQDAEYRLLTDRPEPAAACILLTEAGSRLLAETLGMDFRNTEQEIARHLAYAPSVSKNIMHIALRSGNDTIRVQNVMGLLPGRDTNRVVIVGAHYDHLGKRENLIYHGSDDNASGVAGLLALAKIWTGSRTIPPCNILFASWTAEEKGLIGSGYYTSQLSSPEKVKLYINMDMISRSAPEDSAHSIISIGTRTADEALRDMARKNNALLQHPFTLDLWDVTGHTGSDYASFTARNIPVMSFFSGFHDDYHTPRDIPARAELQKMGDVLKVVNDCLWEFLGNGKAE